MPFEVNGKSYTSEKLGAMDQFHLMRKLTPILLSITKTAGGLRSLLTTDDKQMDLSLLVPIAEEFSKLPESDCNYILSLCLGTVRRVEGAGYAPIWSKTANAPLYNDINMISMLQIAIKVIQDNLGDFTLGPSQNLTVGVGKG